MNKPSKRYMLISWGVVTILFAFTAYWIVRDDPYGFFARPITGSAMFDGKQFIFSVDEDVRTAIITVNGDFAHRALGLEKGIEYTIGAMQFVNSDGERFNPFKYAPKTFKIESKGTWGIEARLRMEFD